MSSWRASCSPQEGLRERAVRSAELSSQERQAICRKRILRLRQRAPDGGGAGDGLVVRSEGLDDHGAVVVGLTQGSGDRLPGDVVGARRAAVVATGVEVDQPLADAANGRGLILLLDIHMEGIE